MGLAVELVRLARPVPHPLRRKRTKAKEAKHAASETGHEANVSFHDGGARAHQSFRHRTSMLVSGLLLLWEGAAPKRSPAQREKALDPAKADNTRAGGTPVSASSSVFPSALAMR
jgi:hypothetical protein